MEDGGWDLQAVVRGCSGTTSAAATDPFCSFPLLLSHEGWGEQDDLLFCFPDLFGPQVETLELEELWKPFFSDSPRHQAQQQQPPPEQHLLSPQGSSTSCSAAPQLPTNIGGAATLALQPQQLARQPLQRATSHTSKPKRRKNQQKTVVQVPADGLSSDMWAWRKYGQKPIKGSPYPRGYYRCSSSKGCLARKQVERSRTDPGMFLLTYTGEHNHPVPTHRNSLAGSTRQKFPSSSSPASPLGANSALEANAPSAAAISGGSVEQPDCKASPCSPLSSPSASGLSPATPLTDFMEEEPHLPRQRREEEEGEEDDLLLSMEMLGEDDVLFLDLEGPPQPSAGAAFGDSSDHFGAFPAPWMASHTAAAAGGR